MHPLSRLIFGVTLVGGLAGFGYWALTEPPMTRSTSGRQSDSTNWNSSRQCRECHQDVYSEWEGSHHQISYLNPEVRKLSDDFRNKECQACHLPRPISITGYDSRSLPRFTRPSEGVDCLTCHLGANGEILGRRQLDDAPCRPRRSAELVGVELCASCHNQHKTTDQWRSSRYATDGVTCNSCHMPKTGVRQHAHHGFRGAHDVDTLRQAARFWAEKAGDVVVVGVANIGAGHNLPTEERHRAVDIVCRFLAADGSAGKWDRVARLRQPYRDEAGDDTQLAAGAESVHRVPIPKGAVTAELRLWYRLTPYVDDADPRSTMLYETTVILR